MTKIVGNYLLYTFNFPFLVDLNIGRIIINVDNNNKCANTIKKNSKFISI